MADYNFVLPFPPSVNVWKTPFRNRMILSKRGREYRKVIADIMQSAGMAGEMLSGRLSVCLILHPPSRRKYDIDNFTKSLFDALTNCGFWEDDELVDRLNIVKTVRNPEESGSVTVSVSLL